MMPEQQNWEQAGVPRQEDVKELQRRTLMVKKAAEEGVEDEGSEPLSPGQEQVMYQYAPLEQQPGQQMMQPGQPMMQ